MKLYIVDSYTLNFYISVNNEMYSLQNDFKYNIMRLKDFKKIVSASSYVDESI